MPTMAHPLADVAAFSNIGLEASWEKPNVILIMLSDRNARFQTGKAILTEVGTNEIKALAALTSAVDFGVPVEKFKSVKGWSYDHPLVQGTGPEVWGRNRRVEFRVI